MLRTKLTMIIVFVLSLGLVSCCLVSEKAGLNPGVKEKITEVKAKVVILVDEKGDIVVTDDEGKTLNPCTIEPSKRQCKGLQKGYGIENLNGITILQSKGSPWCITVYDMQGMAEEYCWEW
ncbi:MAG: hypothetical protein DRP37_04580 [Thermodesulfobacteriota bacterium]|nr:MAG: hypothetical protein DRP37_04580 [Thermodesulfobacteriota bacterium]